MTQVTQATPILDFFRGTKTTPEGHTYSSVMMMTDHQLEGDHDYIQWLFPTSKPSMFHDAPPLTEYEAQVMSADPDIRRKVLAAFDRILQFWGFVRHEGRVLPRGGVTPPVMTEFNHNWLRMTRAISSLRELGHREWASALCNALLRYPNTQMSRQFWEQAAGNQGS